MENLILKYLNNELGREEWLELQEWLDQSDSNKKVFNKLQSISLNMTHDADDLEEKVWLELTDSLNARDQPVIGKARSSTLPYLKVAAIILFLAGIVVLMFQLFYSDVNSLDSLAVNTETKEAAHGQKITTRLPDGSLVTLNSGSKITFPERSTTTREVTLTGEAFFEVQPNPEKPFVVKLNGDKVQVLGTSFNIRSYAGENAVYVSVATGKVSYQIPTGEKVVLEPGQTATYLPDSESLTVGKVDKLQAFGWKDKIIYFNSIPFDKVIIELERWYGVQIEVSGDFKMLGPFTGEFHNEPLSQVLKGLSYVYPLEYQIEGDSIAIHKNSNLNN